jgi:hypothetical protein
VTGGEKFARFLGPGRPPDAQPFAVEHRLALELEEFVARVAERRQHLRAVDIVDRRFKAGEQAIVQAARLHRAAPGWVI